MFDSRGEAERFLSADFPAGIARQLEALLTPAVALLPGNPAAETPIGDNHIGGRPDLPAEIAWPVRSVPDNQEEIIARGGPSHSADIRRHLHQELPMQFALQLDLQQIASIQLAGHPLPDKGRLLFFFDGSVLPWAGGSFYCHVLLDQSPTQALQRLAEPEIFNSLSKTYIEDYVRAWNESAKKYGLSPTDGSEVKSPYHGPLRPLTPKLVWQLPNLHVLPDALRRQLEDSGDDELDSIYMDNIDDRATSYNSHLFGQAKPEQHDPAFTAAQTELFGKPFVAAEIFQANWPRIQQEASNWLLLLQLNMSDYYGEREEGTVYFYIRREDIAKSDFSRVSAVYQQT